VSSIKRAIVVGAGIGGPSAALRLARRGVSVQVFEARPVAGGLAGSVVHEGLEFDAGPYVLLDRPGLEWAFAELGIDVASELDLQPIPDVYEVGFPDGGSVGFHSSLDQTAQAIETRWPGSGRRYEGFVRSTISTYRRLQPLQRMPRPGPWTLIRSGGIREVPFLLRSLAGVMKQHHLPDPLVRAIAIWTQVAGQDLTTAPSPMAFIPALIHEFGAFLPRQGTAQVSRSLTRAAVERGVEFHFGRKIARVIRDGSTVRSVVTQDGDEVTADAVVINSSAVGAYLELLDGVPHRMHRRLSGLPLQSPGVCAYLKVKGGTSSSYLKFHLPDPPGLCRLFVDPDAVLGTAQDRWRPARIIAPMNYDEARAGGPENQRAFLDRILAERWWRDQLDDVEVLGVVTPATWGDRFTLFRDSMNPVMTARFMRQGRIAHKSPCFERLYFAGSSTHPGQWISFCAISGLLAADRACEDLSR
jgi:phytoene dehydrogenase-like protein